MIIEYLKNTFRILLCDALLLIIVMAASALPGIIWKLGDPHLYIDDYKVVPWWLLPVWPLYTFVAFFSLAFVYVHSLPRAVFRLFLSVIGWAILASDVVPWLNYGDTILVSNHEVINPSQMYSLMVDTMAMPSGIIAGYVAAWARHNKYKWSLRQRYILITVFICWLALMAAMWRGLSRLMEIEAAKSAF